MIQGIIGRKLGMTQVFRDDGRVEAATAIEAGPCTVLQVKSKAKEGYDAVQLGFGRARKLNSPQRGHQKEIGQFRYLREIRLAEAADIEAGTSVDVSIFNPGELVNVSGVTKGKGFAGVVKRYHFAGGPKTHGQSDRHRAPGSIGATTSPGRVWKGLHMAGRMGNDRLTVRNLEVLRADPERNLLVVKGAVPGGVKGLLIIRKADKGK